jgi:uncharacterized membrane protein (DUF4010 family)
MPPIRNPQFEIQNPLQYVSPMTTLEIAWRFAAAVGLGVFLGLERERAHLADPTFAGVRTFALIALLGATAAYIQLELDSVWYVVAGFVAVLALALTSYVFTAARGEVGITTEITALLAYFLGALCLWDRVGLAAALAVVSGLLLFLKDWLHGVAGRIQTSDITATLIFAIITLIILPLLPNETFGPQPLNVLNPYRLWLMVVLISGLNFASYLLVKVVGPQHGIGLTGLLGGLVSSTAVTLGFTQHSQRDPLAGPAYGLGIVLAWTVMFVRVLVVVAIVNPALSRQLLIGLGPPALASLLVSGLLFRRRGRDGTEQLRQGRNPFELSQAIKFGVVFGVITLLARAAEVYLGSAGLYLAGAVAGLTDVDAISLSMANLAAARPENLGVAARTVVIAVLSNTLVKSCLVLGLGAPALRRVMLPSILFIVAAGVLGAFLAG